MDEESRYRHAADDPWHDQMAAVDRMERTDRRIWAVWGITMAIIAFGLVWSLWPEAGGAL